MSRATYSGLWPLLLLLLLTPLGCHRTPPEQRLHETVIALQAALEARDAAGTRDVLADDFVGPDGMDRDAAAAMARLVFLRHRNVAVSLGPMRTTLQDSHATVAFTALVTGGQGGLLPESGRIYHVRSGWRLEAGEWKLTSAQWEAATD